MATLTVRNLDDRLYERLKDRARLHQRSLEAEVRTILGQSIKPDRVALIRRMDAFREPLEGKFIGDTTAWIREERDSQ